MVAAGTMPAHALHLVVLVVVLATSTLAQDDVHGATVPSGDLQRPVHIVEAAALRPHPPARRPAPLRILPSSYYAPHRPPPPGHIPFPARPYPFPTFRDPVGGPVFQPTVDSPDSFPASSVKRRHVSRVYDGRTIADDAVDVPLRRLRRHVMTRIAEQRSQLTNVARFQARTMASVKKITAFITAWSRS